MKYVTWRVWLSSSAVGVVSGCLAFGDYELNDEAQPSQPAMQTPASPGTPGTTPTEGECDDGDYSCVPGQLRICTEGEWSFHQDCSSEQVCSAELGACVTCKPGEDYACDGTVLTLCSATGNDYAAVEDCAESGLLCDTDFVPDSCFECRVPERRCSGTLLEKCVGHSFGGGTPCTIQPGCIPGVDGQDYCAECSTPGEEACSGAGERARCSDGYLFEVVEECPFGCVAQGATVSCRATAE